MKCPNCGGPLECDEVDIGVGVQQSGPLGCFDCGWVEPSDPDPEVALEGK